MLINDFKEIDQLIPEINYAKNGNRNFSSVSEETIKSKEIYAILCNNKKNNVYTLYKVAFVIYKTQNEAYLLINNIHSAINSSTPSVKITLDDANKNKCELWGFKIDKLGINIRTVSKNDDYTIYFGTEFNDFITLGNILKREAEKKKELVVETVYV